MALPAVEALARVGDLVVHGRPRLHGVFAGVDAEFRPPGRIRADVAVLFAPSFRAAWEARRVARVIGTPTDLRRFLLSDVVSVQPSRAETYRRLAAAAGAEPVGVPLYAERGRAADVPLGHVALNPLVAGGSNREWPGFTALADQLGVPLVFYGGPGEGERLAAIARDHPVCVGLSLPDLAATLQRAALVVSADTGPAHFARAVGVPTLVVHTSTTASRTGPAGAMALEGPQLPCRPCYANRCTENLECQAIPVERVLEAVRAVV